MRKFVTWHSMKNEFGQCSWALSDVDTYPVLTVRTQHGQKSTQLGGSPPDFLARVLMRELFYENAPGQTD
jgi:hypothetical protein